MYSKFAPLVAVLFLVISIRFLFKEGYRGIKKKELNSLLSFFWIIAPNMKMFGKKAVIFGYFYILLGMYLTYIVLTVIFMLLGW